MQGRLQRCVMECNDKIKDQMPPNPSETEIARFTSDFERCAVKANIFKHIFNILRADKVFSFLVCRWKYGSVA